MFLGKYSEEQVRRFKALANFQFECEIYDKDAVLVMCEKYGVGCINPWKIDTTGLTLSDDETIAVWGKELVEEWCQKAETYIKSRGGR